MPSFSMALTVGCVVMPQTMRPCLSALIRVSPAPTPMRVKSFELRWERAAMYSVRSSVPEPMSVTPTALPFQSAGDFTPEPVAHISRSPGAPLSCTMSMTFLPCIWKSMVCTYHAPAMSTSPEAMASSAPTPPACSVLRTILTPYFL